jgi:hypothetical protein
MSQKDRYIRATIPDGSGINYYFDKNLKKKLKVGYFDFVFVPT